MVNIKMIILPLLLTLRALWQSNIYVKKAPLLNKITHKKQQQLLHSRNNFCFADLYCESLNLQFLEQAWLEILKEELAPCVT